ncbi:MAG: hypothetical protein QM754_21715 [Tepidisphaeraceae bacterium]
MTLWPISMFSMILATPRVAAPAHQALRFELAVSIKPAGDLQGPLGGNGAPDVAGVAAPRDVSTSRRIASSSAARLSMSASVRCANSGTSVIAMRHPLSVTYTSVTYGTVGY